MNLVDGEILSAKECDAVLDGLEGRIVATLERGRLDPGTVLRACDRAIATLREETFYEALDGLGIDRAIGRRYMDEARRTFSGDVLRRRLLMELGEDYTKAVTIPAPELGCEVTHRILPLGVLLHIAAGNADGLPAFSVLEGLLTGNINILKLPAAEGGISVRILRELIKAEPSLREYIYVFDYSSRDLIHMEKLVSLADGVVVWGGSEAVSALRQMVPPNSRLIEWGHKLSFAYVTKEGLRSGSLEGLAENIAETGQLLCSSLQGIYVDTDDMDTVYAFCRRFLPILEEAVGRSQDPGLGVRSQAALRLYTEELESIYTHSRVFRGQRCSLTAYPDSTLDASIQFGNAWVRPLPRDELLRVLRPYKNTLQTVGLLCSRTELQGLTELLLKTGAVRVCAGENMSRTYMGAPHDGEYPLRRYVKITAAEES